MGPDTVLFAQPGTEGTARWLRATVGAATGLPLAPGTDSTRAGNRIELRIDPEVEQEFGPEGYRLVVDGYLVLRPTGARTW
ncbi:glycoside hydrolase family 20 zincin-like fold domain-containing protein [Streptomyces hypolithicus]